jgi:hypothetical protein
VICTDRWSVTWIEKEPHMLPVHHRPIIVGLLTIVILAAPVAAPRAQEVQGTAQILESREAPEFRDIVAAAVDPSPNRINPESYDVIRRLPQVTIDNTGDLTVVLALRDEGAKEAIVAAGQADTLTALRAIYQSSLADQVRSATLVGTYGIARAESNRTRERRILRAVLSAARAASIDLAAVNPNELPELLDVWWLHPAFRPAGEPEAGEEEG